MDRPCHGIPLAPSAALPKPGRNVVGGFLLGHGGQEFAPIAPSGQPIAKIGILGHVVRVPGPHGLQRAAAEETLTLLAAAEAGREPEGPGSWEELLAEVVAAAVEDGGRGRGEGRWRV